MDNAKVEDGLEHKRVDMDILGRHELDLPEDSQLLSTPWKSDNVFLQEFVSLVAGDTGDKGWVVERVNHVLFCFESDRHAQNQLSLQLNMFIRGRGDARGNLKKEVYNPS